MTKKLFLVAITWLSLGSPVSSAEPDEKLHRQCLYPTVKVVHEEGGSGGSGFIVRSEKVGEEWRNTVLSCAHNFRSGNAYYLEIGEYEDWSLLKKVHKYDCKVVTTAPKYDLAVVVFTSETKMPVVEFGFDEKLYIGTKVFKFGHGFLDPCRLDRGEISWLPGSVAGKDALRTNAFTVPGDSGGPLFKDYKVIGVVNSIRAPGGHMMPQISYSVPIGHLKKWDEEQKSSLGWVYTTKPIPALPFIQLNLEREMAAAEKAKTPNPMESK